jgi:hypothetical protein
MEKAPLEIKVTLSINPVQVIECRFDDFNMATKGGMHIHYHRGYYFDSDEESKRELQVFTMGAKEVRLPFGNYELVKDVAFRCPQEDERLKRELTYNRM